MNLLEAVKKYSTLANLERYNTRWRIKNESVAEHSFFVTLIAMMLIRSIENGREFARQRRLADQGRGNYPHIDHGKVLSMAIIHDLPECEISDIPHLSKKAMNIDKLLKKLELEFFKTHRARQLYAELEEQTSLEAKIVKFADIISVLTYAQREVMMGNHVFVEIIAHTQKRLKRFDFPKEFSYSIIKTFRLECEL